MSAEIAHWTLAEICELTGAHPTFVVVDVRSNRIVCHRLRRKNGYLYASEKRLYAHISGVEPGHLLYEDCRKNVFKLVPQAGTPFHDALQGLIKRGKL
jgi:hypothetical protein